MMKPLSASLIRCNQGRLAETPVPEGEMRPKQKRWVLGDFQPAEPYTSNYVAQGWSSWAIVSGAFHRANRLVAEQAEAFAGGLSEDSQSLYAQKRLSDAVSEASLFADYARYAYLESPFEDHALAVGSVTDEIFTPLRV